MEAFQQLFQGQRGEVGNRFASQLLKILVSRKEGFINDGCRGGSDRMLGLERWRRGCQGDALVFPLSSSENSECSETR